MLMTPAFNVPAAMWLSEERTLQAFRTGGGVAWGEHDDRLFCGVATLLSQRPPGANLVPEWLPSLDGVVEHTRGRRDGRRRRLRARPTRPC